MGGKRIWSTGCFFHSPSSCRCLSKKATWSTTQLKFLYTNACKMGNKQEELEAITLLRSYNLVAITETGWDESHGRSVAIDGYRLFRRDK